MTLTQVVESAFEALSGRSYSHVAPPPPAYLPSPVSQQAPTSAGWPCASQVRLSQNGGVTAPPAIGGGGGGGQQPWTSPGLRAALESMSTKELEVLVTDTAAFAAFTQPYLRESKAGQQLVSMKEETVNMAKQNLNLLHVRSSSPGAPD